MKVYLKTFGCRANQYDTEAVRGLLASIGASEAGSPREADVAVFNSCTVTAAAEADLRADVRRAARENPAIRSVVMGCAPGVRERDERVAPLASLPGVTSTVRGADLDEIALALGVTVPPPRQAVTRQTSARAQLRIQDGCDEHCTFCATTVARGANRSRPVAEVVSEARMLASSHPEIVLTGIHIGSYGSDIGGSLSSLVSTLIEEIPSVRFRLTSIEATEVDDALAELLVDGSRLVPHLHAPLQSGSDRVLRRMGRTWYDARAYEDRVRSIVGNAAVFALSADVITGFPGETEADHADTMKLAERLPFTSLHVFPWSPRPGTAATRLGSRVSEGTARRRAHELRQIAAEKGAEYARTRDGGRCDVVVTRKGAGLTEDYLSVAVPDTIPRRARLAATLRLQNAILKATPDA
jgi:threonylcarbamoyladenosine tRNA methylthiotransferase MtaB